MCKMSVSHKIVLKKMRVGKNFYNRSIGLSVAGIVVRVGD